MTDTDCSFYCTVDFSVLWLLRGGGYSSFDIRVVAIVYKVYTKFWGKKFANRSN